MERYIQEKDGSIKTREIKGYAILLQISKQLIFSKKN